MRESSYDKWLNSYEDERQHDEALYEAFCEVNDLHYGTEDTDKRYNNWKEYREWEIANQVRRDLMDGDPEPMPKGVWVPAERSPY